MHEPASGVFSIMNNTHTWVLKCDTYRIQISDKNVG